MATRTPSRQRAADRPPLGRTFATLLAAVVVTGSAGLWAVVYVAPERRRTQAIWAAGTIAFVITAAVTLAVYGLHAARHYRDRVELSREDADRLADEALPALVGRLRDGASVETALASVRTPDNITHVRILKTLAQEVGRGERMRAAAMSACANAAGRVQALATSMLADLREMEHRHDEAVLGDLLLLDHRTAQAGRLADSIAVLTGARSGRRWTKPIIMESILRGAMGRIGAYQRVRLHSTSTVAVAGHAAEGVMHALAELMDNATSFSPPTAEVHVYVEEVYTGVVITIEDGGLVMSDVALERAQKAVSAAPLDLTTLSGTRLGLAVVGCLARKHGLTISFRPSSRGGTGVVMMIPQELITQSREPSRAPGGAVAETQTGGQRPAPEEPRVPAQGSRRPAPAPAPVPAPAPAPAPAPVPVRPPAPAAPAEARRGDPRSDRDRKHDRDSGEHAYSGAEYGESGLPKRRRGQTLAAAPDPAAPESDGQRPAQQPARSPEDSGERFLAFRRTVQGTATPTTAPGSGAPRFPEGFGTVGGVDPWADNTRDTTGQNTGTGYDTATGAHALSPTRPEGFGTSGAVVPWSDDHHGTSESDSE